MEPMVLPGGIQFYSYRDTRFKQGALSIQFLCPMQKRESAYNALLPAVLLRGTEKHPDLRSITLRLDDLYGAAVSASVRRVGDYQTTGFYCNFMEDKFALDGDEILAPMLDFVFELLLDPVLEDGGFSGDFVESEKKNLISTIEAEFNDKRVYAGSQLLKNMCKEDAFGLPRLGETKDVEAITARALYEHYRTVLEMYPVQVFYVGSAEPEGVARLLEKQFGRIQRAPVSLPPQTALRCGKESHETEELDIAQAKLCMGFVTPITNRDPDFPAMQVLNTVFGGGMTSKLFENVRERMSLCYSIYSGYYGVKGIMTVSAGIDEAKEEQTRAEILAQLEACRAGDISEEELTAAKEALLASLATIHDSPSAIESYYATAALSGIAFQPDAYAAGVAAVTVADVAAAAQKVRYHSSFFLKGGSQ